QCDTGGAVRVVLDVRDLGRHTVLVRAPEVDEPVGPLVAAALVPGGDPTVHVAPALGVQRPHQRLLRLVAGDRDEVGDRRAATSRRRRLVLADAHVSQSCQSLSGQPTGPPKISMRSPGTTLTTARLVSLRLP